MLIALIYIIILFYLSMCLMCLPTLQTWALSSTPSSCQTFPISNIYAKMDYFFWRKNSIIDPEDDRDFYP